MAWIVPAGEPWHADTAIGAAHGGRRHPARRRLRPGHRAGAAPRLTAPTSSPAAAIRLPSNTMVLGDRGAGRALRRRRSSRAWSSTSGTARWCIEPGAEVRSGTRLEGPCWSAPAPGCWAASSAPRSSGPVRSSAGEVAASVFLGYANKAPRRLRRAQRDRALGQPRRRHDDLEPQEHLRASCGSTSRAAASRPGGQFLGSLIGDHAKTAIGTMLSTGTVIGAGANVLRRRPRRHVRAAVRVGRERRAAHRGRVPAHRRAGHAAPRGRA